jgi:predicted permease
MTGLRVRLRSWLLRLAGSFGNGRSDEEIREELEVHREFLADEYARSGMMPEAARRRAAVELGSLPSAAEAYQDRRGVPALEAAFRDTRMAARALSRTPLATLSMTLVLGLGIGLSTAIVAAFHAVVWAELPVPAPEAVVRISQSFAGLVDRRVQGQVSRFSYPELELYRRASRTMSAVAGVSHSRVTWRTDAELRVLRAAHVTGDYFRVLPVTPAVGRLLTPADARQPVMVIGHRLWSDAFDAAPDIAGRTLWLDGSAYTIVGVAPRSFFGTEVDSVSVWLPLEVAQSAAGQEALLSERNMSWLQILGRLAPGATLETARAETALIAGQLDQEYPGRRTAISIARATRLDRGGVRGARGSSRIVTGAAGVSAILLVLLFICGSNAAALLLARGAARQKEIAVRIALGAARGHILRQLTAEIGSVAMASAGVGLVVCFASLQALASVLPMRDLLLSIQPEARVFGFAFAAACGVALLFGLAPARQALQVDCLASLKGDGSVFGRLVPALRLRRAIIAVQVTVSVVLLVAASLLGRGVSQAWQSNPGYETKGLFVVQPDASWQPGERPADRTRIGAHLVGALERAAGVRVVARATLAPFYGTGHSRAAAGAATPLQPVHFNRVDEHYFAALGPPLLAGRSFRPGDDDAVVINAALARQFWTDERSAVGQTLFIPANGSDRRQPMQVIGVAPTLQTTDVGIDDEPTYYTRLPERDAGAAFLLVRAAADAPVQQLVSSAVRAIDPEALAKVTALDARLLARTTPARVGAAVAGLIGAFALVVAAVGIHGVVAYTVACRTREIGVHRALGARTAQVLRLILGGTLRGVAIGAAAAVFLMMALAVAFGAQLRAALNGVHPLDPASFALGVLVLSSAIGLASYLPARRALGMEPVVALRRD